METISVLNDWHDFEIKQFKLEKNNKTVPELAKEFQKSELSVLQLLDFLKKEEENKNTSNLQTSLNTIAKFKKSEINYIKQYHKTMRVYDIALKLKKDFNDVNRLISIIKHKPELLVESTTETKEEYISIKPDIINKPWTAADELDLVEYKKTGLNSKEIGLHLNRTEEEINKRLELLSDRIVEQKEEEAEKSRRAYSRWTKEKDQLLLDNYKNYLENNCLMHLDVLLKL